MFRRHNHNGAAACARFTGCAGGTCVAGIASVAGVPLRARFSGCTRGPCIALIARRSGIAGVAPITRLALRAGVASVSSITLVTLWAHRTRTGSESEQ